MQVRKAPRFITVMGSNANKQAKSVELLFAAVDGQRYMVELDPALIAATTTAMANHMNELAAIDPDLPSQALEIQAVDLAMTSVGDVALQLHLVGALKLVLRFPPEQVGQLASILDELKKVAGRKLQ
jgi:hypothetical protein